jgi:hypothetical protein
VILKCSGDQNEDPGYVRAGARSNFRKLAGFSDAVHDGHRHKIPCSASEKLQHTKLRKGWSVGSAASMGLLGAPYFELLHSVVLVPGCMRSGRRFSACEGI